MASLPRPKDGSGDDARGSGVRARQTIRDTLAAHAADDVVDYVVHTALLLAQAEELPADHDALIELVEVQLLYAARLVLGRAAADLAIDALRARLLEREGATAALGTPTLRMPPRPFDVVLVAREPALAAALRQLLAKPDQVRTSAGAGGLLDDLRDTTGRSRIVFADADSMILAADSPDVVTRALVVLRGASAAEEDALRAALPRARFVRCSAEADVEDLAMLLRVGAPPA